MITNHIDFIYYEELYQFDTRKQNDNVFKKKITSKLPYMKRSKLFYKNYNVYTTWRKYMNHPKYKKKQEQLKQKIYIKKSSIFTKLDKRYKPLIRFL